MQQQGLDSAPGDLPVARPGAAGFAGLLASLTAPKAGSWPTRPGLPGDLDGLEDDVATLSYERALHTHSRYKPPAGEPDSVVEDHGVRPSSFAEAAGVAPPPLAQPLSDPGGKRASVTVRMSKAECAQLRQRAIEAGMTVSAYLRSCTFEAESLRAQVKQALAALRAAQAAQRPHRSFGWLRLFHRAAQT